MHERIKSRKWLVGSFVCLLVRYKKAWVNENLNVVNLGVDPTFLVDNCMDSITLN